MNSSHLSTTAHSDAIPPIQRILAINILKLMHYLLALAPSLLIVWIELLAWRASILLGHWPRPNIDDPKFYIPADRLFDLLYYLSPFLFIWFAISLVMFPLFTIALWKHNRPLRTLLLILLYVAGWLIGRILPDSSFAWYLD